MIERSATQRSITSDVACVILAGGRATRFDGRIKAHIEIDGISILERLLRVVRSRVSAIVISANRRTPYAHTGLPIVADRDGHKGPLAGLAAGLSVCRRPNMLALASDMPYVGPGIIDLLFARRAADVDAVVPFVRGQPEPLCALYARRILPVIERRLQRGRRSARGLILDEGLRIERIDEPELRAFDPALSFAININRPADIATEKPCSDLRMSSQKSEEN